MSDNNSLGDRIRKNGLSTSFNQKSESISTSNEAPVSSFSTDIVNNENEIPQGIFSKIAFPLSPILTIVTCVVADVFLAVFFQILQKAEIIEGYVDSWGEYINIFTSLACFVYLRDCLKKWIAKNGGNTLLANVALIVCYGFILFTTWFLIKDLYLLITAA